MIPADDELAYLLNRVKRAGIADFRRDSDTGEFANIVVECAFSGTPPTYDKVVTAKEMGCARRAFHKLPEHLKNPKLLADIERLYSIGRKRT